MTVNNDWDNLIEEVEKIEGDLSDIGFMIEFAKIWNRVKDAGYKMKNEITELKEKCEDCPWRKY